MATTTPRPHHPPPHHHHHQPPKSLPDLELTILSAKHLKNVNWRSGDLKPYAVAYIDPERRSATKPDDFCSVKPIWNERLSLPLPSSSDDLYLTLDVFHSKPSETPKPLVGTARVNLKSLLPDFPSPSSGPAVLSNLDLHRPSGRPHGKIKIKVALRERPTPVQEQITYQMPPLPTSGYYYSTTPPPQLQQQPRDYFASYSPPPMPPPPQYGYPATAGMYYGGYSASVPPPIRQQPVYYDSAVAPRAYEREEKGGGRIGMGAGLAVGAIAGGLGGLTLAEGVKREEDKVSEKVESSVGDGGDGYRREYDGYYWKE